MPWGTPDPYAYFLRLPPLASLDDAAFGGAVPQIWKDFIAHPDYDEFWTARSHARYLTGVRPAVLTVGGFYDAENAYGAVHTSRAIAEGKPRGDNHVLLGPWRHHGWDRGPSQTLGDADFGTDTSTIFPPLFVGFFEHHLKGAPDPGLPVATVFEGGADRWRRFPAWPPPGAVARTLHFQPDGGLAWTAPPATTTPLASFVSDPARPVPYTRDLDTGWMTAGYMAEGVGLGLFTPTPNERHRAAMMTVFALGSLVMHRHLRRLLDVDIRAADLAAQPGFPDYLRVQMEVFSSVVTPSVLAQYAAALDTLQEES